MVPVLAIDDDDHSRAVTSLCARQKTPADEVLESQVLDAFIAQHYLNVPYHHPSSSAAPVDKGLLRGVVRANGCKVTAVHNPREQRRVWLEMATNQRRAATGAPAVRGRVAAGAYPCFGRGA
jgi:excinuclease UvrABC nuclease subunit